MPPFEQLRSELTRSSLFGPSPVAPESTLIERRGGRFLPEAAASKLELSRLIGISLAMGEIGILDLGILVPTPKQLKRISFDDELGCWNLLRAYDGQKNHAQYGSMSVPGIDSSSLAHRTMYIVMFGAESLPNGRYDLLDHVCETKTCCYPRHLERVTYTENTRRGRSIAHHDHPTLDIWRSATQDDQ